MIDKGILLMTHADLQKFADGLIGMIIAFDHDMRKEEALLKCLEYMQPGKAEHVIFAHEQLNKMRIQATRDALESN